MTFHTAKIDNDAHPLTEVRTAGSVRTAGWLRTAGSLQTAGSFEPQVQFELTGSEVQFELWRPLAPKTTF